MLFHKRRNLVMRANLRCHKSARGGHKSLYSSFDLHAETFWFIETQAVINEQGQIEED